MSQQDDYVERILAKYVVPTGPGSGVARAALAVAAPVRNWAGALLANFTFSGSNAKGTATSLGTDVDFFISLKPETSGTLKDIFESLYQLADSKSWSPRRQNVSIGATIEGVAVDLTPGRLQQGSTAYHSLYTRKSNSWIQTNVSLHISTVVQSQRTREIRALKIWRRLHNVEFPSFLLELALLESLRGQPYTDLASNVTKALKYLAEDFPYARLIDPANTNNIVSEDLTDNEKRAIATRAAASAAAKTWGEIIW